MFSARTLVNVTLIGGGAALLAVLVHGCFGLIHIVLGPAADHLDFLSKLGIITISFVLGTTLLWLVKTGVGRILFPHLYREPTVQWEPQSEMIRQPQHSRFVDPPELLGKDERIVEFGSVTPGRVAYYTEEDRVILRRVQMIPSIDDMDKMAASDDSPTTVAYLQLLASNFHAAKNELIDAQSGPAKVFETLKKLREPILSDGDAVGYQEEDAEQIAIKTADLVEAGANLERWVIIPPPPPEQDSASQQAQQRAKKEKIKEILSLSWKAAAAFAVTPGTERLAP